MFIFSHICIFIYQKKTYTAIFTCDVINCFTTFLFTLLTYLFVFKIRINTIITNKQRIILLNKQTLTLHSVGEEKKRFNADKKIKIKYVN